MIFFFFLISLSIPQFLFLGNYCACGDCLSKSPWPWSSARPGLERDYCQRCFDALMDAAYTLCIASLPFTTLFQCAKYSFFGKVFGPPGTPSLQPHSNACAAVVSLTSIHSAYGTQQKWHSYIHRACIPLKRAYLSHNTFWMFTAVVTPLCTLTTANHARSLCRCLVFLIFPSIDSRCQIRIQGEACYPVDVPCITGIGTASPGTVVSIMSFNIGSHISAGCGGFLNTPQYRSRPKLSDSYT